MEMTSSQARLHAFRNWISQSSRNRGTRIVLALDGDWESSEQLFEKSKVLLRRTITCFCAVKLGRHTVLNLGIERTKRLIKTVHSEDIPCIIDDKINDIGETNRKIVESYFRIGFDGLTANPFAGWRGGLQPLFQLAHEQGNGVILLAYMSHLGAAEGYGQSVFKGNRKVPQYRLFADKAVHWGADGVVVGATRPNIIREIKSVVQNKVPIYSPGIGTQGGSLISSSRAGADFFIIGRSITKSPQPEKAAREYARESVRS